MGNEIPNSKIVMNVPYFQVPNKIYDVEVSIYEQSVYIYLCRCGNQGASIFPSYNTIAKKCNMSRRKAIDAVDGLIKKELIRKQKRAGSEKDNDTNIYEVLYPVVIEKDQCGAQDTLGVVQDMHQGSAQDALGVVHDMHQGSAQGAPNKEPFIKEPIYKEPIKKDKPTKKIYLDFVKLTDDEYIRLINEYGEITIKEMIEHLNYYIGSKGDKYKSHYYTILSWLRRDGKKGVNSNECNRDTKYNNSGIGLTL